MSKSAVINIETQTEDGEVISLCHINENSISLDVSPEARKLFKLNRNLFDRINNTTKIEKGTVTRLTVTETKEYVNRLMVKVDNSFKSTEKDIASLIFGDNFLSRIERRKIGRYEVNVDPSNIKPTTNNGIFNPDNVTEDDIRGSKLISSVQELILFQDLGIKTLLIRDNLNNRDGILEVSYRIELTVSTSFRDYIQFINKRMEKAINFLNLYYNEIVYGKNYDRNRSVFKKDYTNRILNQIGIKTTSRDQIEFNSQIIKDSDFGQSAETLYNCYLLLGETSPISYEKVLNRMLPINNSSPESINSQIKLFEKLKQKLVKEYDLERSKKPKLTNKSSISFRTKILEKKVVFASRKIKIETDKLGYNIFSNNQKGLNVFTRGKYQKRFTSERSRFYNNFNPSSELKILTPRERADFRNTSKHASSFLTPIGLRMGEEVIDTSRGLLGIDTNKIKQFRMLKSLKAKRSRELRGNRVANLGRTASLALSKFNVFIGPSQDFLVSSGVQVNNIDSLIDASEYVGIDSYFITRDPEIIRQNIRKLLLKENKRVLSVLSDVIPRRYLRDHRSINSINEIKINNADSRLRKGVISQAINLTTIPPQIKAMCVENFTLPDAKSDPIKNPQSSQLLQEVQSNVYVIMATVGFRKNNMGFFDVRMPIVKSMSNSEAFNSKKPILAKAQEYELPELGIVKDKILTTIYNNLIYIGSD